VYHAGRIAVYALLGAIGGATGHVLANSGFGRAMTIAAGGSMLAIVAAGVAGHRFRVLDVGGHVRGLVGRLGRHLRTGTRASALGWGVLNGLLPCGLLYAALAAAAGTGRAGHGALFMAAFGLGSIPALGALALGASAASPARRPWLARLRPVATALVAILLIARGFGFPAGHAGGHAGAGEHDGHQLPAEAREPVSQAWPAASAAHAHHH
jgi:sulfite exporter TauE/SafE